MGLTLKIVSQNSPGQSICWRWTRGSPRTCPASRCGNRPTRSRHRRIAPGRCSAPVVLASTHEAVLELVPLAVLRGLAVDVPDDPITL
jgi:hypothetical protein